MRRQPQHPRHLTPDTNATPIIAARPMSFTRKYLLWLLVPPIAISIPPALLFLSQVVQLTVGRALALAAMLAVMYGLGCVIFALGVGPHAQAVERALEGQ